MSRLFLATLSLLLLAGCATSPLGRSQLRLLPEAQVDQMGRSSFQQIRQKTPQVRDGRVNRYVECVAHAVTAQVHGPGVPTRWQVVVFKQDEANAFALPGGEIGVYSGLLKVAKNQDQLAAVIGHEVGHVLARHANERLSTAYATQTVLDLLQTAAGESTPAKQSLFAALGVGAQVGVLLPFDRRQEREADLIGLDLMAQAGFDPRQVIPFWRNMQRSGGARSPEFLSTHPSGAHRIQDLEARLPHAFALYRQAQALGRDPQCGKP